ncbi:MAG TPA: TlpA family protein disulfide reductase, partial [Leucothrix sp.]|nr:TlpA family protein disulfide reductase [Leucothrix sp.]
MKTESSIKKIVLGLCLFLIVAVMSTKMTSSVNAAELKKVDKPIDPPALVLENLKGEKIDLADYKGKVVLVQFWATYCIPCRTEMPSMNKLMHKLQEAKVPFEILAVDMGETKAEVQKFVDEVKPEFTMLLVSKDEQIEAWNVFATPSNFLIGTEGKIQYT